MKIALFGATGAVGGECLAQALEAGHELCVLARRPSKLPGRLRERVRVVEGNALDAKCVADAMTGADAVLFAIGVDKHSPEDLCTDVTRHILSAMPRLGVRRLVFVGGGSTPVVDDATTLGSRFVEFFARTFMGLRHRDKIHQLELLEQSPNLEWLGLRPLQIRKGPLRGEYRLGFHPYSGLSWISFADCAHAMLRMLEDDTWLQRAPIIQY